MRSKRPTKFAQLSTIVVSMAGALLTYGLSGQARQSTTGIKLNTELAAYFETYSNVLTIDERIEDATRANSGQTPKEIVIKKSRVHRFVDNGSLLARQTGISPLLLSAAANSDLIVMGTPLTLRSLPIKDRTFLFTEYSIHVDRVFFDKSQTVTAGDTIIVSRQGGNLLLNGVAINAIEPAFDQFSLNEPYIFGLKVIPNTDSYVAIAPWTFVIADGHVSSASKLEANPDHNKNMTGFTSDLQAAVAHRQQGSHK